MKWDVHNHCFTIDHIPEEFFSSLPGGKKFLKISTLNQTPNRQIVWFFTRSITIWLIKLFSKDFADNLKRLKGLFYYKGYSKQCEIVQEELNQYIKTEYFSNNQVNLVLLPMDLKYMEAGNSKIEYLEQLKELKQVKKQYGDRVKIFLHTDPRRIEEDKNFLIEHLPLFGELYCGFKIYPTLGYYPFDKTLKEVYDFALKHNYPILSHVSYGPVYRRKNIDTANHPITNHSFFEPDDPFNAQQNFAHPLNYECLLNKDILRKFWNDPSVDYSDLKINLAHFGGPNDWALYQKVSKKDSRSIKTASNPLDIQNDWFGNNRFFWFEIIKALMSKYSNVYTDIAFTVIDKNFNKSISTLLNDSSIRNKILYGTDYYVVAGEKKFSMIVKKMNFQEKELDLMSETNPSAYFRTD